MTTAIDHPSRRLVVALPQTAAVGRELDGLLAGLITSLGGDLTAFVDADGETV